MFLDLKNGLNFHYGIYLTEKISPMKIEFYHKRMFPLIVERTFIHQY